MADPFDYDNGFIYVDLDGTLAYSDPAKDWKGYEYIGEPIPAMVAKVKAALAKGYKIKIFTARAFEHGKFINGKHIDAIGPIEKWCQKHLGQIFEVTCQKAPDCVELFDDRAFHVIANTGIVQKMIGCTPDTAGDCTNISEEDKESMLKNGFAK